MNFKRAVEHHEIDFDLTAMIDVIFLLIIFFTFSTVFTRTMAKRLDLPKEVGEASATVASNVNTITVDIAADGAMSLTGAGAVTTEQLVGSIRAIAMKAKAQGRETNLELIVRADRLTPARYVNQLAGALGKNGVRSWKLATAGEGPAAAKGVSP